MGNYKYKCISLSLKSHNDEDFVVNTIHSYESALNDAAKDGWDFVRTDTVFPHQQKNNLKTQNTSIADMIGLKVLIFKKYVGDINEKQTEISFVFNEDKITCPSCRNEVSKEDIYCENCATKLK